MGNGNNGNWVPLAAYYKNNQDRKITINDLSLSLSGATECSLIKTFQSLSQNGNDITFTVHDSDLFHKIVNKEGIDINLFPRIKLDFK